MQGKHGCQTPKHTPRLQNSSIQLQTAKNHPHKDLEFRRIVSQHSFQEENRLHKAKLVDVLKSKIGSKSVQAIDNKLARILNIPYHFTFPLSVLHISDLPNQC